MSEKAIEGIEQWLSIGSKAVTVLFLPSLWVFHLYLDNHLDERFSSLSEEIKNEFVHRKDAHLFASNGEFTTFKTSISSNIQTIDGKVDINAAKVEAHQINIDLRLNAIKEDVGDIKQILNRNYPM